MKTLTINKNHPIEEDEGWQLFAREIINKRTLICYSAPNTGLFNISLFHLTKQPNLLSQTTPKSPWGYATYCIRDIITDTEATELVNLYLIDMFNNDFWWETEDFMPYQ